MPFWVLYVELGLIIGCPIIATIIAIIKNRKNGKKTELKSLFGLSDSQLLGRLKTKTNKLNNEYRIPLKLNVYVQNLTSKSDKRYIKFLSKLTNEYLKRKNYYRNCSDITNINSQIDDKVVNFLKKHKILTSCK